VDYGVSAALVSAAVASNFLIPKPRQARWDRAILWDGPLRNRLGVSSRSGRTFFGHLSDGVVLASLSMPFWHLWTSEARGPAYGEPGLWLAIIDAYGMSMTVVGLTKHTVARARPYLLGCGADAAYGPSCESDDSRLSFMSGHTAVAATGAGLNCAMQRADTKGRALCGLGAGLALGAGALRMASDNHWASDVVAGYLTGFLSGYLAPYLLIEEDGRHLSVLPTYRRHGRVHSFQIAVAARL
jgi:membrane-associated phospholipid phosphatase